MPGTESFAGQSETVVSMREYIKERCLTFTRHHHAILRAFAEYEEAQALGAYERQVQVFYAKMGNVALRHEFLCQERRYPEEYDELDGDDL